jgi:hypothetical protein
MPNNSRKALTTMLRFWNDEILTNQQSVLQRILEILSSGAPSPAAARRPLPEGEAIPKSDAHASQDPRVNNKSAAS